MEKHNSERIDELPTVETPEDVAVLYSWANLHGAKYRDFSASRREYRAQLRHRAAEQARDQELRAQASAESSASFAERAARQEEETAMSKQARDTEYSHQQALQEAEKAARVAAAERIEATRRAEAAAVADMAARREEREMAEANASARKQAAQYADSEVRRRQAEIRAIGSDEPGEIHGEISDPYTPQPHAQPRQLPEAQSLPRAHVTPDRKPGPYRAEAVALPPEPVYTPPQTSPAANYIDYAANVPAAPTPTAAARRPQGYRPDDASGVRQIYRGPEFEAPRERRESQTARQVGPAQDPSQRPSQPTSTTNSRILNSAFQNPRVHAEEYGGLNPGTSRAAQSPSRPSASNLPKAREVRASAWADGVAPNAYVADRSSRDVQTAGSKPLTSFAQQDSHPSLQQSLQDPTPRRRRQDSPGYKEEHPSGSGSSRRRDDTPAYRASPPPGSPVARRSPEAEAVPIAAAGPEPSGPAWLYATVPQTPPRPARRPSLHSLR